MWLEKISEHLNSHGGEDLLFILTEISSRQKMSYLDVLELASEGHGVSSSEGTGYGLDQDWDYPEDFDHVAFFIGEYESSVLSIQSYVQLVDLITKAYLDYYPDDKDRALKYLDKLHERYSR